MGMIGKITGTVAHIAEKHLIIDISGLGYKVYATDDVFTGIKQGDTLSLFTHLVVREDALDLYGFTTEAELLFFEMLITVSGVGPRGALQILSINGVETLRVAIGTGDTSYLTKVSGIGKKTAEKIVIELRDKLEGLHSEASKEGLKSESDALEALKALGYSQSEARSALKGTTSTNTNDRIKEALKILSR